MVVEGDESGKVFMYSGKKERAAFLKGGAAGVAGQQ
jgi:hypothetical protein